MRIVNEAREHNLDFVQVYKNGSHNRTVEFIYNGESTHWIFSRIEFELLLGKMLEVGCVGE